MSYLERIHRAEVTQVAKLGPGMIRVSFGGADMSDYPSTGVGDEYVRLFFPDEPGQEPVLPVIAERGWEFPEGAKPSQMRTYTIRAYRPGEVDIDFVVHDGGIASTWALAAEPGFALGINPPRGLYERPSAADRQILVADEPALPAALRIAELTPGIETDILCEIRGAGYELLPAAELKSMTWVRGSGNGHRPSRLIEAVRRLDIPSDGSVYVWMAGESRVTREVRGLLRHELGLPGSAYKTVGYWTFESEAWTRRYENLAEDIKQSIDELYEAEGDPEANIDEVFRIYASVGL